MLRTLLRYVKEPRAESGLRSLIAEAEDRLELLDAQSGVSPRPPSLQGSR